MAEQDPQNTSSQKTNLFVSGLIRDVDDSFTPEGSWSLLKICNGCGIPKLKSEYSKDKTVTSRIQSTCKQCRYARSKIRKKSPPEVLTCSKCRAEKSITEFTKDKCKTIGYRKLCKLCNNIQNRINWRDRPGYKEVHNTWKRNYRRTEAGKASYKRHYQKVKENPHFLRVRYTLWHVVKKRGIKKMSLSEDLLEYTVSDFKKRFPNIPKGYHIDHIIPVVWFKDDAPISVINSLDNLQIIPASVNLSKGDFYADPISPEFMKMVKPWILNEYLKRICIHA